LLTFWITYGILYSGKEKQGSHQMK